MDRSTRDCRRADSDSFFQGTNDELARRKEPQYHEWCKGAERRTMTKTAQELMVELGEVVNDYLADSPQIRDKIAEIKTAGYGVVITLEANVVLVPDKDASGAENFLVN